MKRIAIINDIHGNYYLLIKCLEYLKNKKIDLYLFLGDFLTDGPDSNKIIEKIKSLNSIIIKGNREISVSLCESEKISKDKKEYPIYYTYKSLEKDNLEFIKKLSTSKEFNYEGKKIVISHGSPYNPRECIKKNDKKVFNKLIKDYNADIYLFAHTHLPFKKRYKKHLFINSGAINCYLKKATTMTFGILTIKNGSTSYEQIKLPFNYEEVKSYYINSNYYKECFEWASIILSTIKTGNDYLEIFSNYYDSNKTCQENYQNFIKKYPLNY